MKKYYIATRGQLFQGVETGGWRIPLISGEQLRKGWHLVAIARLQFLLVAGDHPSRNQMASVDTCCFNRCWFCITVSELSLCRKSMEFSHHGIQAILEIANMGLT